MSGGAIAISSCPNISITLSNMNFISNNATASGGAVYSDLSSDILINDALFTNNIASNGGTLSLD